MQIRHSKRIRVYYEDTDAGAVVYYANYLKFFERVRSDWLRELGVLHVDLRHHYNAMFVVHQANLHCHRPAVLEDELRVDVAVQSHRRASMVLHQTAHRIAHEAHVADDLIASCTVTIAYIDCATLRPKPFPQRLLDHLNL
jgi:acyl-CoA thioester hydrolase